jgi:Zn finger protein HypA/HybF involved in hydrogenase expression
MDISSIAGAVGAIKGAADIAKGLLSIHTTTEIQAKVIELNQVLIDAQHQIFAANTAQSAMVERVRQLEGQIAAMENWNAEKQRYQLASPHTGAMVQALKKAMSNGEIAHYLCANCFQRGRKSVLSIGNDKDRWTFWGCPECKSKALTGYAGADTAKYAEDIPKD